MMTLCRSQIRLQTSKTLYKVEILSNVSNISLIMKDLHYRLEL